MKLEAVTVCYGYADFLAVTLPENLPQLDRLVVVTHPSDAETKTLCTKYGVDCIETEVFHDDGDKFNKGRAINLALGHCRHDDWLLHLDADIVLPPRLRYLLGHTQLNPKNIYGMDRLNSLTYENWVAHKSKTYPQHQWRYMVTPNREFPLGSRLLHQELGYLPCGYFQLWHKSLNRKYPVIAGSAEHSDALFAAQWRRDQRLLIPEGFCYHLESDPLAKMGVNWQGRKTPRFGPTGKPMTKPPICYGGGNA